MKEAGQSLLNGGILIIGFIILVVVLTSLPGGQPATTKQTAPAAIPSQPIQQTQPAASVPSAIRGARQAPPTTTTVNSGQSSSAFGQRRRRDLPQPRESAIEMENRIRNYLDK